MIRSIVGVSIGVLLGVTIVIFASFIVSQMLPADIADPAKANDMRLLPFANQAGVVFVWFVGAFIAALVATLIARRWAPVSWIVAATMSLFAMTNYSSFPAPAWMQLATYALLVAAGWAPIKLLKASYERPRATKGLGL